MVGVSIHVIEREELLFEGNMHITVRVLRLGKQVSLSIIKVDTPGGIAMNPLGRRLASRGTQRDGTRNVSLADADTGTERKRGGRVDEARHRAVVAAGQGQEKQKAGHRPAKRDGPPCARSDWRRRGRRGRRAMNTPRTPRASRRGASAGAPQVSTPRGMHMAATPRETARRVRNFGRPQGHRKRIAGTRGLSVAQGQAGSQEGSTTKDKGQGGMEGAGTGRNAVMIPRPPGRRPSQVLAGILGTTTDRMMAMPPGRRPSQAMVDITPMDIRGTPTDRMMATPPGRRPSQVMVDISSTAAVEKGQGVKGSAVQRGLALQGSSCGTSQGRAHRSDSPRRGEGKGMARARVGETGEDRGGGPPIASLGQKPEAANR